MFTVPPWSLSEALLYTSDLCTGQPRMPRNPDAGQAGSIELAGKSTKRIGKHLVERNTRQKKSDLVVVIIDG